MIESSLSPWARLISAFVAKLGVMRSSVLLYFFCLVCALILSSTYYYILDGAIAWFNVLGVMVFFALTAPFFVYVIIELTQQLHASFAYLENATLQGKQLNQTLTDNIQRLNSEIDERKMAFQAKRRAIDELRKEIAERKRTQLELAEQGVLLRSIVDSSPDLFYYRDDHGNFAGCNRMFAEVMGIPAEQLIGKKAEEIYCSQILPSVLNTDKEVEQQQKSLTLDVQYPVNGEVRWFEMRKVPFFNAKQEYIGLLGFGRDITSRKEAEQALEQAFKDKGKFIATLSHELRTPLNGIVGLTRMLLETDLNANQRSWCNTVFSSAETLGNIFNDIIDLDKVDRDQLDIACESVNVSDFLNDVINFGGLIAQQKDLDFLVEQQGVLDIYAQLDPTRLRQVLWNLINNAVKFTARGSVKLRCIREYRVKDTWLVIEVIDSGIGIAQEHLKRIFDMYYKVPDINGGNALGSGIGLAVTKALITAMGGKLEVFSEQSVGSRFRIEVPLKLSAAPQVASYSGRGLNILLVEDVPLNAEIATNLLEQRGHEVLWAETGEDALAFVETEDDLDLILLDMQLPDINGDEVARIIRSDPNFDHLPIVALTANVRRAEEDLAGIKIQGALAKPISTLKLDRMFSDLFSDKKERTIEVELPKPIAQVESNDLLVLETINDFVESMGVSIFARSSQLFHKLWPQYVTELETALQQDDLEEYKSVAHKLKGAAGSVGLLKVQQVAKLMEDRALDSTNEQLGLWIEQLPAQIKEGLDALQEYLAKLS